MTFTVKNTGQRELYDKILPISLTTFPEADGRLVT